MLGVQQMIGGSIGKVGNIYTVSARVIDVQTGEVLKSANYDHIGDIGQLLIKGMKEVVNQLITGRKVKRSVIQTKGKGTLYIKSTPSAADVWVNGYKVAGKTPLTIPDLDEGSHTLQIVKQQFELTKTVSVKANEITKVNVVLQLSKENLNVFSTPDGASVSIDGISQTGLTPITVKELSVGQHTIKITKKNYELHEAQINIEKDKKNEYNISLDKLPDLLVTSTPGGASVFIDGRSQRDNTPLTVKGLSVGQHTVKITKAGYIPHEAQINIEKNKTNQHSVILVNMGKKATLTLTGNIRSANIEISSGGKVIEKWEYKRYFPIYKGDYILKVSKDGYKTYSQGFSIKSGEDKSIKIDLELITGSIIVDDKYPSGTVVKLFWNGSEKRSGNASDNIIWKVTPKAYQLIISCAGYLTLKKDIKIIPDAIIRISDPLESNQWVLKEIKSLKMKRNLSFVFAGVIAGTGGYLRSLADKQYTDYQVAGSNTDELRDKVETTDSLAPVFFGAGGVSLSVPLYYHSKIGTLTKMLSD
jgi:hypothetical protein